MKYRKKPVVIDAIQWDGKNTVAVCLFMGRLPPQGILEKLEIDTLEGKMSASPGDWIIEGVNGEFYPCKPDIFEKTYEEAGVGFQKEEGEFCPVYSISDKKLAPASKVILRSPVGDVIYRLDEDKRQFPAT